MLNFSVNLCSLYVLFLFSMKCGLEPFVQALLKALLIRMSLCMTKLSGDLLYCG